VKSRGDDATGHVMRRLQAGRGSASALETEYALARLESALFGAPHRSPVLDRYPLIRELGRGASGVVYLAHDPRLDRKVAIKLLDAPLTVAESSEGRARLLREAQAIARAPHPNVVAVYDIGTYELENSESSGMFMVMEYVEGVDLQAWLEDSRKDADTGRPWWRDVVEVFMAAGRGLAAAHAVGVTHRDFKPSNVIVGDDGRARVLDFGLARGDLRSMDETTRTHGAAPIEVRGLDALLTAEGTVLGTPAYMAPEQHEGRVTDAASDQFSFCVAMWEGLYGVRPFAGKTLAALAQAKLAHAPIRPPDTVVPRWIEDVLRRGLEPQSARRWPSMQRLLDVFTKRMSRRRRRAGAVVAVSAVVPLVWGAWFRGDAEESLCTGASERLHTVWNDARGSRIQAAFASTNVPYAPSSLERVQDHVAAFATGWVEQHRDACEATNVRDQQSAELMDLRMRCLDRQLHELDALLDVLERADESAVERASKAAGELPRPERCANVEALLAEVAPPSDPEVARAVIAVREELDRVKALQRAGAFSEALKRAQVVAEHAAELGYTPAIAETLAQRGALETQVGELEASVQTLATAHATAVGSGHELMAVRTAEYLVFVVGARLGRLEPALEWARIADAEIRRSALDHDRSRLRNAMAQAYGAAGKLDEAKNHALAAIDELEQLGPPGDEVRMATLRNNLGEFLRQLGELDAAQAELARALEISRRSHGPDHPSVAMPLNNLGGVHLARGEHEQAEARYRDALEIRERALGPDHPVVATTLANLAIVLRLTGRLGEARSTYERALAILRSRYGSSDLRLAGMLHGLAFIDVDRGEFRAALETQEKAIAIWEEHVQPDHPDLARGLLGRSIILAHLGEHGAAWSSFERSTAMRQKVYGRGHAVVGRGRHQFAQALHVTGHAGDATRVALEALEELDSNAELELIEALEAFVGDANQRYARSGER
jgi:eukaryotic-like serine/threonine-protein kinase